MAVRCCWPPDSASGVTLEIGLEPQQRGDFLDAPFDLLVGPALDAQRRGDVLEDRERRVVDELLVDHRHGALADVDARHVLAVHHDAARGRDIKAGEQTHEGGLARERRSQQDAQRARLEREGDLADVGNGADDAA